MVSGRSILSVGYLLLLSGCIISCSGGGGDSNSQNSEISTSSEPDDITFEERMTNGAEPDAFGYVVDSPVSGLHYRSGDHYGITDGAGKYGFIQGESVEFFIGDIAIGGAIVPAPWVTPYELAGGHTATTLNIARFLQTLDNDANPDNGIQIIDAVHMLAAGVTIDFSGTGWEEGYISNFKYVDGERVPIHPEIELPVFELTSATEAGARYMIRGSSAYSHLRSTLRELISSLGSDAKAILNASTCENVTQCKKIDFKYSTSASCAPTNLSLVYSELNADIPAYEQLEANRVSLIDTVRDLSRRYDDNTGGYCLVQSPLTHVVCNESSRCEIVPG